jgi:DNA polymerase-3 subunit delta'
MTATLNAPTVLDGTLRLQPTAGAALAAAAGRPVHAYLLTGPAGTGKTPAAAEFAAALLCPAGGCGTCHDCTRVVQGLHPDVTTVERDGPAISMDTAREIIRLSVKSPIESTRKVLILTDFHLIKDAGPALLKTIEEPPPSTTFVILADHVPPELVTVASRCVTVPFSLLSDDAVTAALVADGVPADQSARAASAARGNLDTARRLLHDPGYEQRRYLWWTIPDRVAGATQADLARLAGELVNQVDAALTALKEHQARELADLVAQHQRHSEVNGKARRGTKTQLAHVEDRQKRQQRRVKTDELRDGLAVLAGRYRADTTTGALPPAAAADKLAVLTAAAHDLIYNPADLLYLEALLIRLTA